MFRRRRRHQVAGGGPTLRRRRKANYEYMSTRFDALEIEADESQLTVRPDDRRLCAAPERTS